MTKEREHIVYTEGNHEINMTKKRNEDEDFPPVGGDDALEKTFRKMLDDATKMLSGAMMGKIGKIPPPFDMTRKDDNSNNILFSLTTDLTQLAKEKALDSVVGRDDEIRRLIEVLCRRKKNNPVLIGEPGVGKSAIVEGLAQMIVAGKVPDIMRMKRILSLDMTGLVAGTRYRGDFEERIKELMKELEKRNDIILFIDEIHTIVGAGGASGTLDAANILKPALARGKIQCVGTTTLDEYRKSIEKDGALERRFQKIIVDETSPEDTLRILATVSDHYQRFHHVRFSEEALNACVSLAQQYITDRKFPDKAIDIMDEVGAHIRLSSKRSSNALRNIEQEIEKLKEKKRHAVCIQNFEMAAEMRDRQHELEKRLEEYFKKEMEGDSSEYVEVTLNDINEVVSHITGIPVKTLGESERERLKRLAPTLRKHVVGQDDAVNTVVKAIQRSKIGIKNPSRPIGVFLFLGPTGVGKTFLAQEIAREIYGTQDALIRVDMSEYNESFNTSRLVGAPPGYVGYDEGGQLTERVRRKPYSVVLLDEIEKAHPNVYNMLLQVLDEGRMTDGNGRLIDFRNTIIIMTSNTGTRQLKDFGAGIGFTTLAKGDIRDEEYAQHSAAIIRKALQRQFAPEFLNRLDEIVTFRQLSQESIKEIVSLELRDLARRIAKNGYKIRFSEKSKAFIAEKGYDVQYGARPLKRAIQQYVEDAICDMIINESPEAGSTISVKTSRDGKQLAFSVV